MVGFVAPNADFCEFFLICGSNPVKFDTASLDLVHLLVALHDHLRDHRTVVPAHNDMERVDEESNWVHGRAVVDVVVECGDPEDSASEVLEVVAEVIHVVRHSVSHAHPLQNFSHVHGYVRKFTWQQMQCHESEIMLEVSNCVVRRESKTVMDEVTHI